MQERSAKLKLGHSAYLDAVDLQEDLLAALDGELGRRLGRAVLEVAGAAQPAVLHRHQLRPDEPAVDFALLVLVVRAMGKKRRKSEGKLLVERLGDVALARDDELALGALREEGRDHGEEHREVPRHVDEHLRARS
jgi:hypothetical protein